jgi:type VI secretion system secreted protein VgrG
MGGSGKGGTTAKFCKAGQGSGKSFSKDSNAGGATQPCPLKNKKQNLVAVEVLDASGKAVLGSPVQYVNLPRATKWVDAPRIPDMERLSPKLRVRVRFKEQAAETAKLKLAADASNATYSAAEKRRNSGYKFEPTAEKSYKTGADGTKTIDGDFVLAAAGKDKYGLVGTDKHGTPPVKSTQVETRRRVFLKHLKMKGVRAAASVATFTGEYAKHGVEIVDLGSQEMVHLPNIGTSTRKFQSEARKAYKAANCSGRRPYVVAVGYTDHLAVKDADQVFSKSNVEVGPGKADVTIPIMASPTKRKYLWNNIVPGEGWFVSAVFKRAGGGLTGFMKRTFRAKGYVVGIPKGKCTPLPLNAANPAYLCKVKIKVSDLTAQVASGEITLKVHTINRMRGGLSFPGGNLICVCTRAWWANKTEAAQNQTMVHEMGHKVGMVPDGSSLDRTSTQYTGKGHVGSHCHAGLPVRSSYSGASGSRCVMFGATNGITAFCADCAKAVRRVDLSKGWRAF